MDKMKLVYVEDNVSLLTLLEAELEERYDVVSFSSSKDALDYMSSKADSVDILLTDFKMPDLDGINLISQAHDLNPKMKKVLLTGYYEVASNDDRIKLCDLVLDKSTLRDVEELVRKITSLGS